MSQTCVPQLLPPLSPVPPPPAHVYAHTCRDQLDSGRIGYKLVLTYKFTAAEGGKYKPSVPLLNQ